MTKRVTVSRCDLLCFVFLVRLPRHTWPLLSRFRTDQGPCRANLHKWGLAQSPSCDCGQRQTMDHIVDTCQLTKVERGLKLLHEVVDDAVIWLESTATTAFAKWMKLFQNINSRKLLRILLKNYGRTTPDAWRQGFGGGSQDTARLCALLT